MADDQLTSTGIEIKTLEERLEEIRSSLRGNISSNLDLSTDTPTGQFVSIIAEKIQAVAELVEEAYGQFDPDQATGTSLASLSRLTGTVKQEATKGTATLILDLDATTTVPAGSIVAVDGDADNQWETDSEVISTTASVTSGSVSFTYTENTPSADTITRGAGSFVTDGFASGDVIQVIGTASNDGFYTLDTVVALTLTLSADDDLADETISSEIKADTYTVTATAAETGNIQALSGTITDIISTVSGWNGVINAVAANPGEDLEDDVDLRLRREREVSQRGSTSVYSIVASLSAIEGVLSAKVYNNPTATPTTNVPAPHAFHAVVWDGVSPSAVNADLAEAIFDNSPAGIQSYGGTSVTHTDTAGVDHTISFSRPAQITIDIEIEVSTLDNYVGDTAVETAIEDYLLTLGPGDDVNLSDVIAAVNVLDGVDYVVMDTTGPVFSPGLAINPASTAFANVVIGIDEIAVAGTITVTS